MPEIANFVNERRHVHHARGRREGIAPVAPVELEFTQIRAPHFPHLVDQLEFLANAVEDSVEGAYKDLPYTAVAQAVFALLYTHRKMGIIPDSVLELGRADDSSVVRAVLIQNEKSFALYATTQSINWQKITSQP